MKSAHRISWEIHRGPIPPGGGYHGTCVLHKCDVTSCVNPDHLFLGTVKDNAEDMKRKGRSLKGRSGGVGSANNNARLSENDVMLIFNAPGDQKEIAKTFNTSQAHVSRIKVGKAWSNLTGKVYK